MQGVVEVVKKGAVKNIAVSMEDRQGGRKHITRLVHVESFALNPGVTLKPYALNRILRVSMEDRQGSRKHIVNVECFALSPGVLCAAALGAKG